MTRTEIARLGGLARAKQLTPEHQRRAQAAHKKEDLSRWGRKGYEVTTERYGKEFATRILADHRRQNPTLPEMMLEQWLSIQGLGYFREYEVDGYYYDFHITGTIVLVEVDSKAFHGTTIHGEDRSATDRRKDEVAEIRGYHLIRLSEEQVYAGDFDRIAYAA